MARRVNEYGEQIVDTALEDDIAKEKYNISTYSTLVHAKEAIRVLQELLETPWTRSIHFEFDVEVGSFPIVTYKVERFVHKEN